MKGGPAYFSICLYASNVVPSVFPIVFPSVFPDAFLQTLYVSDYKVNLHIYTPVCMPPPSVVSSTELVGEKVSYYFQPTKEVWRDQKTKQRLETLNDKVTLTGFGAISWPTTEDGQPILPRKLQVKWTCGRCWWLMHDFYVLLSVVLIISKHLKAWDPRSSRFWIREGPHWHSVGDGYGFGPEML